ncbi:MAG: hypothetical protein IJ276_00070 [Alphaproteobacteria bacterium]|nr:hypothetical protein [Alphaproteobacteria bacterium]
MKKLLIALMMSCGVVAAANSAVVANLDYIHKAIQAEWGFLLPYNDEASNTMAAANMKYLLHAMDETNWTVNSIDISDYAEDPLATMLAADKDATDKAVVDLIDVRGLTFRTTTDTTYFEIKIAAKGTFTIKWGDGTNETFTQDTTDQVTYSHTYDTAEAHYIKLTGTPTEYNSTGGAGKIEGDVTLMADEVSGVIPSIKIGTPENLYKIYNSLGAVFSTLADGSQPSFYGFCKGCKNLIGPIPDGFLTGLTGQADKAYMFREMFDGCYELNGSIPEDLFADISGRPTTGMFMHTFRNCDSLTGQIPPKLFAKISGAPTTGLFYGTFDSARKLVGPLDKDFFAGIQGAPAPMMFHSTFACLSAPPSRPDGNCWMQHTRLTGSIPAELFAGIEGAPAHKMFHGTFGFSGIQGKLPSGLFAKIEGPGAYGMFEGTFQQCRRLGGPIPADLFAGIKWHHNMGRAFAYTFCQTGGMGNNIPENLFTQYDENGNYVRGIQGRPLEYMFQGTFQDSGVNKLPAKLFAGIQGEPAEGMFDGTFHWNDIGDIPEGFFAGIKGAPAPSMFQSTFHRGTDHRTTTLTKIPKGLFAGISGEPAKNMFSGTFWGSFNLTDIGYDAATGTSGYPIFGDISGTWASGMFSDTFSGDTKLASDSAKMTVVTENEDGTFTTADKFLYEVWPTPPGDTNTYNGATGLKDYANIPELWK